MSKIVKEASIWYILDGRHNTVGDLREFVKEMDSLLVPDEYTLEDCTITFHYSGEIELIMDGECAPYVEKYDILVNMDFNKKDED